MNTLSNIHIYMVYNAHAAHMYDVQVYNMRVLCTQYTTRQEPQASQCIPSTHHHLLTDFSHHYHTIDLLQTDSDLGSKCFLFFPSFPLKSLQNKSPQELIALHIEMDPTIP